MATKETSPDISSRAGQLLSLGKPEWMTEEYWDNLKGILASALSQDETPQPHPSGWPYTEMGFEQGADGILRPYTRTQNETPNDPAEEAEATAAPVQHVGEDPLGR